MPYITAFLSNYCVFWLVSSYLFVWERDREGLW